MSDRQGNILTIGLRMKIEKLRACSRCGGVEKEVGGQHIDILHGIALVSKQPSLYEQKVNAPSQPSDLARPA